MITIALMGGSSTLIGVLPTGAQVGVWAPILLVFLRILPGLRRRRRAGGRHDADGRVLAGTPARVLLGAAVRRHHARHAAGVAGVRRPRPGAARRPCWAGSGGSRSWPRSSSSPSPSSSGCASRRAPPSSSWRSRSRSPSTRCARCSARRRPTLLRGIGLRMAENGGSYIYQTLAITYVSKLGVQSSIGPLAVAIGAMLGFFTIPLAGSLSDKYGRMKVYRIGAIVQLVAGAARPGRCCPWATRSSPSWSSRSPTASGSTSCSAPSAPPCPNCSAPGTATSASPSPASSARSSPAASPPSSARCCWLVQQLLDPAGRLRHRPDR